MLGPFEATDLEYSDAALGFLAVVLGPSARPLLSVSLPARTAIKSHRLRPDFEREYWLLVHRHICIAATSGNDAVAVMRRFDASEIQREASRRDHKVSREACV
ncbi:MAG: hypothetical protein ACPGLY_15760 [Rubripirellula sp.]